MFKDMALIKCFTINLRGERRKSGVSSEEFCDEPDVLVEECSNWNFFSHSKMCGGVTRNEGTKW